MANIEVDLEKLKSAKLSVDNLIDTLNDDNEKLNDSLKELKAGWKTDAGKKFFKEHKDTWTTYVNKYVKKLKGVSGMLEKAIAQYDKFDNEVTNLKV